MTPTRCRQDRQGKFLLPIPRKFRWKIVSSLFREESFEDETTSTSADAGVNLKQILKADVDRGAGARRSLCSMIRKSGRATWIWVGGWGERHFYAFRTVKLNRKRLLQFIFWKAPKKIWGHHQLWGTGLPPLLDRLPKNVKVVCDALLAQFRQLQVSHQLNNIICYISSISLLAFTIRAHYCFTLQGNFSKVFILWTT